MPASIEAIKAELARYGDEYLPTAAEQLPSVWASSAPSAAERLTGFVAEKLAGPLGQRHRNPEFARGLPENASVARRALTRFAAELKPEAIDRLAAAWGHELNGLREATAIGVIALKLTERANALHLVNPPARPAAEVEAEARVAVVLADFGEVADPRALAASWGRELRHLRGDELRREIGRRLSSGLFKSALRDGVPLDPRDERFRPAWGRNQPADVPHASLVR